jgi:uncharacterized protein YecE (DUF72 family)
MEASSHFFAGASGLQTPIPKRDFPEDFKDKSRLTYYGSLFNSIEINSSFYKIPNPPTISRWSTEVADNFRFTFKLWKGITHQPNLSFSAADVEKFIGVIDHIGDKRGSLLVQFPPSLSAAAFRQLENLLSVVQDLNNGWKVAVEFRHRSWYVDEVYQLLESFNAALVIHDLPASAAPLRETAEDFIYEYAGYITDWLQDGKIVYTYFNNTAGSALANLQTLKNYVKPG